jgi:hypothetical protein
VPFADVLSEIDETEAQLVRLGECADVPPRPDQAWADDWLDRSYETFWART